MPRDSDLLTIIDPWTDASATDRATPSSAGLTFNEGWPPEYSEPAPAGLFPQREVFNYLFWIATKLVVEINTRGAGLEWSALADYAHPATVLGSDLLPYVSMRDSGPNNGGSVNPVTENPRTRWRPQSADILASIAQHTQANPPDNLAATPAGVRAVRDALLDSPPGALDTLNELAAALGDDANFSATIMGLINARAALAGATFTGAVSFPTPATGDNSTRGATTAWVRGYAGAASVELFFSQAGTAIPTGNTGELITLADTMENYRYLDFGFTNSGQFGSTRLWATSWPTSQGTALDATIVGASTFKVWRDGTNMRVANAPANLSLNSVIGVRGIV